MLFSEKQQLRLAAQSGTAPAPTGKKTKKTPRLADQINPSLRTRVDADMAVWKQAEQQALSVFRPRREALMLMYRQILKDNYLTGAITTLKNKVLSEPFALVDDKGKENTDALRLFQTPWFNDFMGRVLDTDFWGHTLLNFDYPNEQGEFEKVNLIPRAHVVPETGEVLLSPNDAVGLPFRDETADYTGLLLEVALQDEEGNYSLGILNKAVPHVIWKRYAMGDWARRSEKFGMPMLVMKTDAVDETELRNKQSAMANMDSNGWAVIDLAEDIVFKESANQDGTKIYQGLADFQNNEIAYLISGQTATSQETGSRAGGEVHERVQEHYVQARMRFLFFYINFELLPFLKRWGYQLEGLKWTWRKFMDEEQERQNPKKPKPTDPDGLPTDPETDAPAPPNVRKKPAAKAPAKAKLAANFKQPTSLASEVGTLELANAPTLVGLFNEVVAKLHTGRPKLKQMLKSKEWQAMMRETGRQLTEAAQEGYGKKLAGLVGGTPDAELLQKFADNLYVFSANKNYQLLTELNALLTTEAGAIRPFSDFKTQALALHQTYNVDWLETEYNTAVATAQMARKWQGFQAGDTSRYFLKYSTVGDDRVRPEHAELNGIMLPVDDVFWNNHTPPLGWRCRCTLVRVPRAGRTATSQADVDNLATTAVAGFGHNAAKTGVIFPDSHKYPDAPDDVKPLLRRAAEAAPKPQPKPPKSASRRDLAQWRTRSSPRPCWMPVLMVVYFTLSTSR